MGNPRPRGLATPVGELPFRQRTAVRNSQSFSRHLRDSVSSHDPFLVTGVILPVLQSMTGYGEGHASRDGTSATAQLRSVNNRYLKLSCRIPEGYAAVESKLEALLREHVRRGSVQLTLNVRHEDEDSLYAVDVGRVRAYHRQLAPLHAELVGGEPLRLESLLALPGVIQQRELADLAEHDWSVVETAVRQALTGLRAMRVAEGRAMAADLQANCDEIANYTAQIEARGPLVVQAYQQRLTDRITNLLRENNVATQPGDVIREVGVFADRVDTSEEIVRLRSHLRQFGDLIRQGVGAGRSLEFLVQEILRETNTIGSKANDAEIAQQVVQIKNCIERMREMVQNVE